MSTVILAEKPDQARSYMDALGIKHKAKAFYASGSSFLDPQTIVISSVGHIIQLCEPEAYGDQYKDRNNIKSLPIFPEPFRYEIPKEKMKIYQSIRAELDKADKIIVATDPDNEGGAIAYNLLKFSRVLNKNIMRAVPLALDKKAVINQFKNLQSIDNTWRQAQAAIARGRSDWLIGMNLSRLYSSKLANIGIKGNFAVGRAVSATLSMICNWTKAIEDFKPYPIYGLKGKTIVNNEIINLSSDIRVVGNEKNDPKMEYLRSLENAGLRSKVVNGQVVELKHKQKETYAPSLLTKGALYKAMNEEYGWSELKSKKIMQENYDKHYQTYPRTDVGQITLYQYKYLGEHINEYLSAIGINQKVIPYEVPEKKLKKYLTADGTDPAHLAIIPTEKIMDQNAEVTADQRKMYEVVVRHAIALRFPPYTYMSNELRLKVGSINFKAENSGPVDLGWKKIIYINKRKKSKEKEQRKDINYGQYIKKGDKLKVALHTDVSKTKPLRSLKVIDIYMAGGLMEKAYKYVENETFVKILKDVKGIGTSATRDTIVESLIDKKYISVLRNGEISVTANGWLMSNLLKKSEVSSPVLTAKWEEEYVKVKDGQAEANDLVEDTKKLVIKEMQRAKVDWNNKEILEYYAKMQKKYYAELTLGKCPQCGENVVFVKDSKNKGKWDRYNCLNKKCDFVIFSHFLNKKITDHDIEKMLLGQSSRKISGLHSKKSKQIFSANLKLEYDEEKKKYVVKIDQFSKDTKNL